MWENVPSGVRPIKTPISLRIYAIWTVFDVHLKNEEILYPWLSKVRSLSEDSDQTARMLSLIWIFTGRTRHNYGVAQCDIHYENLPIQIHVYWNFYHQKWRFSDKNSDIFHISVRTIDYGYLSEPLTSTHNLCFEQK